MSGVIKAVLFDLDGTLLDTAQDFHESLNELRAEEQLEPLSFETVRAQVSHGGHALVRLGFGTLDPVPHEAMRMRLLGIYRQRLAKYTRLFEGGDEMLDALENRGLAWGIVTNKPGWLTDPLLIEVKEVRTIVGKRCFAWPPPHEGAVFGVERLQVVELRLFCGSRSTTERCEAIRHCIEHDCHAHEAVSH